MPILSTLEEFYKMGPGPSSSHTMGPMRIGFHYHQVVSQLPEDTLQRATALRMHLFGSLSATGVGHGTRRGTLAGLLGYRPATCPPELLDDLVAHPERVHTLELGPVRLPMALTDIVLDDPRGEYPHPNTMTGRLLAGDEILHEQEYYSTGGGYIDWKGRPPDVKPDPPFPYDTMAELRGHGRPLVEILLANERALTGKTEDEVWAFLQQVADVMLRGVHRGLTTSGVLPGPIGLHAKAAIVHRNALSSDRFVADRALALLSSYALAMSEENARGHVIVTAPTAGAAGVVPAAVRALRDRDSVPMPAILEGLLVAAAIGYLCKHNATLSGAEGGCQAEVGVASAMAAALLAHAHGGSPDVIEMAAESALEHHLGMTCDPVAGHVQVPCIERNAFGVVKAWTAFCLACEEVPGRRVVDFDTCVQAMAMTARDMSRKYKETSEGGLAVALVLC